MGRNEIRAERLAKREALIRLGANPYGGRFDTTGTLAEVLQRLLDAEGALPEGEKAPPLPVRAAGRIAAIRDMGKSVWLDLRDRSLEKLQVNVLEKRSPEIF
ncbi:MAG: lysine--tRNA ligase, partial [Planctomycetota bacterium]